MNVGSLLRQARFVMIPWGVVHQNPETEPTRVLLMFSPARMERFLEEAAEGRIPLETVPEDPAVKEEVEPFTRKYGFEFAEFPQ